MRAPPPTHHRQVLLLSAEYHVRASPVDGQSSHADRIVTLVMHRIQPSRHRRDVVCDRVPRRADDLLPSTTHDREPPVPVVTDGANPDPAVVDSRPTNDLRFEPRPLGCVACFQPLRSIAWSHDHPTRRATAPQRSRRPPPTAALRSSRPTIHHCPRRPSAMQPRASWASELEPAPADALAPACPRWG